MAVRFLLVATFVAYANAGMSLDMMQMMQKMQEPQPWGGCKDGMCTIPAGEDMGAYMEKQKQDQKYESEQMAAKIKAQFESVMAEVTMKKHRYSMGIMSEFTSMCACLKESHDAYEALFVPSAKAANMTDIMDMEAEAQKLPYEATTLKDAKERMFGGLLHSMCESLKDYMGFAKLVEDQVAVLSA